jgi:hypothetical protein
MMIMTFYSDRARFGSGQVFSALASAALPRILNLRKHGLFHEAEADNLIFLVVLTLQRLLFAIWGIIN